MNISEKEYSSETNSDSNLGAIIVGYIVLSLLFIVILCCFFSICISICEEIKCLCLCYRSIRGRDIVNNEVNKNVLKYLHDAIAHRNIATVGYYVGGMKESALKETESKQVVVATYAMASEALDIKSLTTLIMVTPKTDIEQSVGRILRDRFSQPVVVDIIDKHSIFQNQWRKRKTFFKKEKYTVITTKSTYYNPDTSTKSWCRPSTGPGTCPISK